MAHAPLSAVNPCAHAHPAMKEATAPRTSTSVPMAAMIVLLIPFATTPTVATFAHAARDTRATAKLAALDALVNIVLTLTELLTKLNTTNHCLIT